MRYPWQDLQSWAPFHIDALGLVTFLGSDEVNLYIGRLVTNRWFEYMPLLGAFVIAGDRFKDKKPSFNIYNITSGITTSDLSSWFTRWILAQNLEVSRSVVYWEFVEEPRKWWHHRLTSSAMSFCFLGLLIAMTVASKDWYGFANAVSMTISVIVRAYSLEANRNAINSAMLNAKPLLGTFEYAVKEWEKNQTAAPKPKPVSGQLWKPEIVKTIVVTSDSKAVTMFIPEKFIIPVFVNNPQPRTHWLYESFRWVGWAAFAVHIIALGLADLAAQMYTVALLVIPTILTCWKVGCDDSRLHGKWPSFSGKDAETSYECWIGSHLKATIFEWPKGVEFERGQDSHVWHLQDPAHVKGRSTRRQDLYAWLNLTADEEDSMGKWDLLPHRRNDNNTWAQDFNAKKDLIRKNPMNIRITKDAITSKIEKRRRKPWFRAGKESVENGVELEDRASPPPGNPLQPMTDQRSHTVLSASGMPTSVVPSQLEQLEQPWQPDRQ